MGEMANGDMAKQYLTIRYFAIQKEVEQRWQYESGSTALDALGA